MTEIMQSSLFDYGQLDAETRIVVQQRTEEIKVLVRRSAQDIIDIGNKLIDVKARLGHGNFGGWLESEFSWSEGTARRFINVALNMRQIDHGDRFEMKALYLLAAPSTPEAARIEAIAHAQAGEFITHKVAQEIVAVSKAAELPPNARPVILTPPLAVGQVSDPRRFAWEFNGNESSSSHDEVVRSETRFTLAPPIRDDEEFDDMVDEAEGDEGGYDWRDEEDIEEYTPPVKVAPQVKAPEWTPCQVERRELVERGLTVHANMKTDVALIEWAKQTGRFFRVDRATEWGNPFHLPDDGDRETVIANYKWYIQKKPSLMKKIGTLKGKVLGCWCHPEPCHAGFLEELTNGEN